MENRRLKEVDFIRTIAIILIVLSHCITLYFQSINNNDNQVNNKTIDIIITFLNSFRLPSLIMISGYTFSYLQEKRNQTINKLLKSKFKRLILPTIVFGIIYTTVFKEFEIKFESIAIIIISGVGHLWFLPMLFWVFVLGFFLNKHYRKTNHIITLIALFVLALVTKDLPKTFGIVFAIEYMQYFFIGIIIWKNKLQLNKNYINIKILLLMSCVYIVLFILYFQLKSNNNFSVYNLKITSLNQIIKITGVVLFYILTMLITKKEIQINLKILITYSFGIYIFHLFILKILISSFRFESLFNEYIGFIILFLTTKIISLTLSILFQKTKVGKFLLE